MKELFLSMKWPLIIGFVVMVLFLTLIDIQCDKYVSKVDGFEKGDTVIVYSENISKFIAVIDDAQIVTIVFKKLDADEYISIKRYQISKLLRYKGK